ncbi:MAG: InlB B-repeat-containing protein [Candidatus Limiplasma sp.]|nr:InlB B-repeat-containing protein [Candidatus Limiplasma sp.]
MKRAIHKLSAVLLVIMLMTQTFGSALAAVTSNTITAPEVVDSPSGEGGQIQAVLVQVSFYGHDGTLLKTASVEAGGSYDPGQWPAAPQREGYDFVGWSDGSAIVTSLENLQADVTLTAQYAQLFTITFENWDGTELAVLDGIRAGTHIVPADYYGGVIPERESFVFDHWEPSDIPSLDADTTVTAVFSHLSQHTITINYVFQNQKQAAPPFIAVVSHGYQFTQTVPSPAILGYTPDPAEVQITDPITEDVTIDVIYHPNGTTRYWVAHLQQELDGSYTEVEREERYGETGSLTNVTLADVKSYEGFFLYTNLNLVNNEIAADETTVIELQYDRSIHYVLFDTADGTYIEPQVAPFGTPVVTPANPTRAGYTFNRWDKPIPATIGSSDVTITAQWTPQTVGYTIVVWRENANDTNFSYATTLTGSTALAGSTVTNFTRDSSITDSEKGYFTFSHADPVIIKGDGSSVQNVYYSRNSYNAKFVLADSGTHLIAGGTTYNKSGGSTHVDYEFTAKYGAAITHLWPSYVGPDSKNFRGWSAPGASSTYTSARLTFTPELLDRTFTALYDGSCRDTLTYMLETPDGTGTAYTYQGTTRYYNAAPELAQTVYSERGSWGLKEITGFVGQNVVTVITAGSTQRPTARNITLYYTRNKNTITYHNGDSVHSTDPIFFDADISSYNIANPPRPSGIPQDYEFRGWYTNPNFYENSKVNWAGAKMPANGLIVYASWQKPIYDVVFDLNFEGGGVHAVNHTVKGDTTEPVTNPTRPGYHFNYWYYIENGVQKLFTFSMPITRNYDLFASWTPTAVRYTVRYVDGDVGGPVYDQSGNVIGDKIGEDLVSATVTENAVPSYNAQGEPVYPDRRTSSLALQANENVNVITFTYRRANVVYYLVRYVDNQGNEIADTKGPVSTTPTTVTERYRSIPGYSPTVYQQTITLAHETNPNNVQQNIITFVYNPNSQTRYIVRHYLQNVDNNQYTLDEELTFTNAAVGSRVHADPKTYTGFHYMSVLSVDNGVVSSNQDNPLVLSLYYNRSIVAYSASYLDEYDSQKLAPDTTGLARYGKQITLIAKDIPPAICWTPTGAPAPRPSPSAWIPRQTMWISSTSSGTISP